MLPHHLCRLAPFHRVSSFSSPLPNRRAVAPVPGAGRATVPPAQVDRSPTPSSGGWEVHLPWKMKGGLRLGGEGIPLPSLCPFPGLWYCLVLKTALQKQRENFTALAQNRIAALHVHFATVYSCQRLRTHHPPSAAQLSPGRNNASTVPAGPRLFQGLQHCDVLVLHAAEKR